MAYLIEAVGSKEQRGSLVILNGVINAPDRGIHLSDCDLTLKNVKINAVNRCIGAYNDCDIDIDSKCELVTSGEDACALLYSDAGRTEAVTKLTVDGLMQGKGSVWTISGNGSKNRGTTEIIINNNAKVISEQNSAIYHPQGGELTVNGGLIEGKDGIYAKAGKIVINGGVIKANGEVGEYEYSGDGTERPLGDAIVMEFTNYPAGLPSLEINGGKLVSENGQEIGCYVSAKCETQDVEALKAANIKDNR